MADEGIAYESWVNSDTIIDGQSAGSSWDIVQLGEKFLPGVCTIANLEIGRDVDVQKKRKKEKARLRDNGLSPVTFNIEVEITGKQWGAWLQVLPYIQPKVSGLRTPLSITHPMVNSHGVNDIYIQKILPGEPTARKGMKIVIKCGEWFEEEKDANGPSKKKPESLGAAYGRPDYFGDPNDLARQLERNRFGFNQPATLSDVENVMGNSFK
jgi:hypothetical protein